MASGILKTLEFNVVREILSGFCSSPLGRIEAGCLRPFKSLSRVRTALSQASEMKEYLLRGGGFPSRGALDAVASVDRALEMNSAVDPDGLCRVSGLLECASRLKRVLRSEQDAMPEVWRRVSTMEDLFDLEEEINRTVDQQGRVLDTASEKLAGLRAKKSELKIDIRRRAEGLLSDSSIARWLQDRSVRLRNNRYVLPVRPAVPGSRVWFTAIRQQATPFLSNPKSWSRGRIVTKNSGCARTGRSRAFCGNERERSSIFWSPSGILNRYSPGST